MSRAARMALMWGLAALCVILDQVAKAAAVASLAPGQAYPFIPHVMDLVLVKNTGAAFSLGAGSGWIFVVVALVVVAVLTVYVYKTADLPASLVAAAGVVAGGGIGNLIDRVAHGYVIDFFATTFVDFAIFNVADIFVCCGVAVGLILLWRWDADTQKQADEKNHATAAALNKRMLKGEAADALQAKRKQETTRSSRKPDKDAR